MNPEIKARWLRDLRSGDFKQGRGRLYGDGKYCCLGVLCQSANIPFNKNGDQTMSGAYGEISNIIEDIKVTTQLMDMNDRGMLFAEIADWIEEHL